MAQGRKTVPYPWGVWESNYANTSEAGLNRTTSVGMYPHGATLCGSLDVVGNVFEWCLNDSEKLEIIDGFGNGKDKTLRGGSFNFSSEYASVSYRNFNPPYSQDTYYGLRLICVPIT
jgi:formylglycine-generating enzyme required for sulfatase activity